MRYFWVLSEVRPKSLFKTKKGPSKKTGLWPQTEKKREAGGYLLSHRAAPAVPSALLCLTSVFGMGTGGSTELWPPAKSLEIKIRETREQERCKEWWKTQSDD